MGLLQSKGPKPMTQVNVKPIKQYNSDIQSSVDLNDIQLTVNNQPNKSSGDTKSKVSVAEIAFGSTRSARFFTLLSLVLVIISICDLVFTFKNYTPDWWDPKITGILGLISSIMISVSLMVMLFRKMNATVMPLNVVEIKNNN